METDGTDAPAPRPGAPGTATWRSEYSSPILSAPPNRQRRWGRDGEEGEEDAALPASALAAAEELADATGAVTL
jgi:hypothetical protein